MNPDHDFGNGGGMFPFLPDYPFSSDSDSDLDDYDDDDMSYWGYPEYPFPFFDDDSSDFDSDSDLDSYDMLPPMVTNLPPLVSTLQQQLFQLQAIQHMHSMYPYNRVYSQNSRIPKNKYEYRIEYAPTSQAKCQKCKQRIEEGSDISLFILF